ncbi:MAG: hypothetical protein EXS58_08905 [Candidatus Latescibacteria bacterium]|nr:hypothetical protein [Candidatus Latescibacterota bacterium]
MRLFYAPAKRETGIMWDTWLYWHQGTYYLYYLARSGDAWDNISLATSTDGVSWQELGPILTKGPDVTWMGTGSTWKSPDLSRGAPYQLNFSEWKGPRQTIFFAESEDLIHWQRRDDCEFVQEEEGYEPQGRWDCIWTLPRPGGRLYGYWTATPRFGTNSRFGMGQSSDGLHWEALPPPVVHGAGEGEVGAIEQIGDRYYMMFGCQGSMMTLVADQPEGPFHAAAKNRILLAGHTYFSRFFPSPQGLLVNHHSIARDHQVYLGLLKRMVPDAESTLHLGWWEGNEQLKRRPLPVELNAAAPQAPVRLLQPLDISAGLILEGRLTLPPHPFAPRRGLYIEFEAQRGLAILFDAQGRAECSLVGENGENAVVETRIDREYSFPSPARWRLVVESSLVEIYLEDLLIECFSLPAPATGRFGLIEGCVPGCAEVLEVWQ